MTVGSATVSSCRDRIWEGGSGGWALIRIYAGDPGWTNRPLVSVSQTLHDGTGVDVRALEEVRAERMVRPIR